MSPTRSASSRGALIKVTAYANITGQRCSYELAKRVLADLIDNTVKAPVTVRGILEATAELFNFSVDQITGGSRRRPLVDARQIAMYVTRNMTDLSYPEIGRAFGNRDHTTVITRAQDRAPHDRTQGHLRQGPGPSETGRGDLMSPLHRSRGRTMGTVPSSPLDSCANSTEINTLPAELYRFTDRTGNLGISKAL